MCLLAACAGRQDLFLEKRGKDFDWDTFFQLASHWRVEQTAFSNIERWEDAGIPPVIRERAQAARRIAAATALAGTLATVDLYCRFSSIGLSTIVLKGPAVGSIAYGDPARRGFGDIDLLVARTDLIRARDFLLLMGYSRDYPVVAEEALISNGDALEFSKKGMKVELHVDLMSRHLCFEIPIEDLWARSAETECAGERIRVLSIEHLFIFLCAHAAKHAWGEPRWVLDIAEFVKRIGSTDVEEIIKLSDNIHAKRLLSLGLRLSNNLLQADTSMFPSQRLSPERETLPLVNTVRRIHLLTVDARTTQSPNWYLSFDSRLDPFIFWLRCRERMIDRVLAVTRLAFAPNPRDADKRAFKRLRRPIRLVARAIRRFLRA